MTSPSDGGHRPPGTTSIGLIDRAKREDPTAWEQLVERYAPAIYRWARRSGLQAEDAAEIVQSVFLVLARSFDRFRKEGPSDSFRAWLKTITRNKVRDFFRKQQSTAAAVGGSEWLRRVTAIPALSDSCDDSSGPAEGSRAGLSGVFASIRTQVTEQTFQAFWLTVVEDRTSVEAADELGMTPGAVRLAKARVLQRVRTICEAGDP